jgi:membrane-bound lytic murein transglycosylase B
MSSDTAPVGSPQLTRATSVQITSPALTPFTVSPAAEGAPVTMIATVTPATAVGTVQFMDGGANVGVPVTVTNGTASITTLASMLAVGSHQLTAVFTPADPAYGPSTSPALPFTVAAPQESGLSLATPHAQQSGLSLDEPASSSLPTGSLGIPVVMLEAYQRAERALAQSHPNCHLSWTTLAGIGKIESGHASGGRVDAAGNTLGQILGPELDGSLDTAVISDTDRGTLDTDPEWDRAVGPMQFIPSSWRVYGVGSPNNIYDSALAAGRYLCAGGADLSDPVQQSAAVYRYNHSAIYVSSVLRWALGYMTGVLPTPSELGPVPARDSSDPQPVLVAHSSPASGVANRAEPAVMNLDSPAVTSLDQPAPANLDGPPATQPASPSAVSLDGQ